MTDAMARAVVLSQSISVKQSIEIANAIRKKPVAKARVYLQNVIDAKQPVAYRRFNGDVGHKKGRVGPGRFPIKAAQSMLKALELVVSNAKDKSLNEESLYIFNIVIQKGPQNPRPGRFRGRTAKNTHIEIVVSEGKKHD